MRGADRIGRLVNLNPGECARAWPFFALYLVLFAAFAVADGATLALFVARVGAEALPVAYAGVAAVNLLFIGGYVRFAERLGGARMFAFILGPVAALFATAWVALRWIDGAEGWYAVLFVAREVALTLLLMHFGTYLQGHFTRDELSRVLPVAYAGGRVGGILGGVLLAQLSAPLGPVDLLPGVVALLALAIAMVAFIARRVGPPQRNNEDTVESLPAERAACGSIAGFLRFARTDPVLFWGTASSFLFMVARWFLNYQYSHYFAERFPDPSELAAFVGRYTQWALAGALLIQLFALNRIVAGAGVGGAYLGLAILVGSAALASAVPMTLGLAIYCRLVETELRYGVRNPLMQLVTNAFSKPLRIRVRAWTMGLLTPAGTLAASGALAGLSRVGASMIGVVGLGVAAAHLLAAAGLWRALRRERPPVPSGRAMLGVDAPRP